MAQALADPAFATFTELFTALRNPCGGSAAQATERLMALFAVPESLAVLFRLYDASTDAMMRQYTVIGILRCLKMQKGRLDPATLAATRQNALGVLQRETDAGVQRAAVSVVSYLFQGFDVEWPELLAFLYSGNANMACVLDLFSQIVGKIPVKCVQDNIQLTGQWIQSGLAQEENQALRVSALNTLFRLIVKLDSVDPFLPLRDLAMQVFQMGITSGDAQLFSEIQKAIDLGLAHDQPYFRLCDVMPLMIRALQCPDFDVGFKMSVNVGLSSFLDKDESESFSLENLHQLLQLQIALICQFFSYADQEKSLLWVVDNSAIIATVYMQMGEEKAYATAVRIFETMGESEKPQERMAGLVVLNEAIFLNPSTFDGIMCQLFPVLLDFLKDPDQYVAQMASETLGTVAMRFTDIITCNLQVIVEAIMQYIAGQGQVDGISLLQSILVYTANSDSVFSQLLPVIFEWLRGGEPLVVRYSIASLYYLVIRSEEKLPYLAEDIYKGIRVLLQGSECVRYADLFDVLGQMCIKCTETMKTHMDEVMQLVDSGLTSGDTKVERAAIDLVPKVLRIMRSEVSRPWVERTFQALHTLATRAAGQDYDETDGSSIYLNSGKAIVSMSCIAVGCEPQVDIALLNASLGDMVTVLETRVTQCIWGVARGFQCVTDVISGMGRDNAEINQKYSLLINRLIDVLSQTSPIVSYDPSVIQETLGAIGFAIRKCGVEIVEHRSKEMIENISSLLTNILDNVCGEIVVHENWLRPISEIFTLMADTTSSKTAEEVLDKLIPLLTSLMSHKLQPLKSFAIDVFADLMSKQVTLKLLPEQFKADLCRTMIQIITDGPPRVAGSAAKFFAMLSKHEDGRPLVETIQTQILEVLVQRLRATTEPTNENVLLREALAYSIASIVMNVAEDGLPYAELLGMVLSVLPVRKDFEVANEVYRFVSSMSHLTKQNPELQKELIRVFTCMFARSSSQLHDMNLWPLITLSSMAALQTALAEYPREEQARLVSEILGGDEYRCQCFAAMCEELGPKTQSLFNPPTNSEDITEIPVHELP